LQFRPNPENLVTTKSDTQDAKDNIYKAPKIAPMPFDDRPLSSRAQRDELRQKEKAARSRLIKDLVVDFDDRPEEHRAIGDLGEIDDDELKDRNRYEEENFVRLQPNKKTLRKIKDHQKGLLHNELLTLDDFRGVSSINSIDSRQKDGGVLGKLRAKRSRSEDDDMQDNFSQVNKADRKTNSLFNGMLSESDQVQKQAGLFKKAKNDFKSRAYKKRG